MRALPLRGEPAKFAGVRTSSPFALARVGLACVLAACGGRSQHSGANDGSGGAAGDSAGRTPVCGHTGGRSGDDFEIPSGGTNTRLYNFVDRDDGSLLGFRGPTLVRLDRDGELEPFEGDRALTEAMASAQSLQIAPGGQALLARDAVGLSVFDGEGMLLAAFEAPPDTTLLRSSFSESGRLIQSVYGQVDPEHEHPELVELRALDGSVVSELLPRERNPIVPASDDSILWPAYPTESQLTVTDLTQTPLYDVELGAGVRLVRVSDDGTHLALQLDSADVTHVENGVASPPYTPDATVWDVKLAPGGRFSSFSQATPGRITLFDAGRWLRARALPLEYVNTFDVNDSGDVVVGGQDAEGRAHVLILDANLDVQFTCAGGPDDGAYSPSVRFTRDGRRAIALFNDRLTVFGVR